MDAQLAISGKNSPYSRGDTLNHILVSLKDIIELDKDVVQILSAQELDNLSTAA